MVAAKAHATAENIMKLVRLDGGKTGLMVQLASGPHVIDVIGSLEHDPEKCVAVFRKDHAQTKR
jgi:hypothetical protein